MSDLVYRHGERRSLNACVNCQFCSLHCTFSAVEEPESLTLQPISTSTLMISGSLSSHFPLRTVRLPWRFHCFFSVFEGFTYQFPSGRSDRPLNFPCAREGHNFVPCELHWCANTFTAILASLRTSPLNNSLTSHCPRRHCIFSLFESFTHCVPTQPAKILRTARSSAYARPSTSAEDDKPNHLGARLQHLHWHFAFLRCVVRNECESERYKISR